MSLPDYMVLRSLSNNRYLRLVDDDGPLHAFLRFTEESVLSPFAKFAVERASTGNGLVHIRSCYNNKYWVKWTLYLLDWNVTAMADEPEEDQSKPTCTLFRPVFENNVLVHLIHVESGLYVYHRTNPVILPTTEESSKERNRPSYVEDGLAITGPIRAPSIVDWESLLILPKNVAFKGDNGHYLGIRNIDGQQHLQFSYSDKGDPAVAVELVYNNHGEIYVKNLTTGKYWRLEQSGSRWILADSDSVGTGLHANNFLFRPFRAGSDNRIALRNLGNNLFCRRLTSGEKTDCYNGDLTSMSLQTQLEVEETVVSRRIHDVNFRLLNARIYDERPLRMTSGVATNRTTEANTYTLRLAYKETTTNNWNWSLSLKLGMRVSVRVGIPVIKSANVEIEREFVGQYEWGKTIEHTEELESVYTVIVPPMTRVTVVLLATVGACDVPFSYYQRDDLINGESVGFQKDDGVYTGTNCYNFRYEVEEEPL